MNFVINDVAADIFKYKNPLGSSLTLEGKKGTIIGVFTDFHAVDLRGPFVPTIIRIFPKERETLLIKYSSGTYSAITNKIGKVFKHYDPDTSFQPRLFSDLPGFSNLNTPSNLVGLAFIIALTLASLGLFGLASFTAESRTKEIGIRKANGATTSSIMRLLLTSYTKWLTIAFFIALPIAFLLGNIFLGSFYFHAQMPVWTFFLGPLIAFIIALLTVSSQAWRASSRNPVKTLRYE
jgi:ABC-type antimicrobial peptide transport system permease subunit